MNQVKQTFELGKDTITIETGRIARQADGAVIVSVNDDIRILATVVGSKNATEGQDFFPLSVHYQEKTYAAGKIPGGYGKREGRPSERETLTSRLIDRPIRPLFPEGFFNEVQVICTVLSTSRKTDPDIASMIGTSAALAISGIPFHGPIGAARVGFNEEVGYILNPSFKALKKSKLDMVVAGTKDAVLMVESEADELNEDIMLGAVLFAHQEMQVIINAINEFASKAGKEAWDWQATPKNDALINAVKDNFANKINDAYTITIKQERHKALDLARDEAVASLANDETGFSEDDIKKTFGDLEYRIVRDNILSNKPRIDGRDLHTVRKLYIENSVLPNVHGSALFTRGETQALVVATLGSTRDVNLIDNLEGLQQDSFMLHYNFPPYSVGECGRMGSVGRREIGHGRLARRGVAAMLPKLEEFPYTIRVVSEITESNGSSSMASVCGASLALMDAGVPMKKPVAGIAMGLVLEGERFSVLTDILGDEDHLGDMDFKVAGTDAGITALQMDIKIEGITEEIMEIALESALKARLNILSQMNAVINTPKSMSESAPTILTMKIHPDKVREVIGKGGVVIREITESTGASIDLTDDGEVKIFGDNKTIAQAAFDKVAKIVEEVEVGKIYEGKVVRITDFGAFVNLLPGKDGLVHISQIAHERIEKVTDALSEGQIVKVKAMEIDKQGKIKLSMKELIAKPEKPDQ